MLFQPAGMPAVPDPSPGHDLPVPVSGTAHSRVGKFPQDKHPASPFLYCGSSLRAASFRFPCRRDIPVPILRLDILIPVIGHRGRKQRPDNMYIINEKAKILYCIHVGGKREHQWYNKTQNSKIYDRGTVQCQ